MKAQLYGKTKDMKRFHPLDLEAGEFVINKIHATTFWSKEDIDRAKTELLPQLAEDNPGFQFELRVQK